MVSSLLSDTNCKVLQGYQSVSEMSVKITLPCWLRIREGFHLHVKVTTKLIINFASSAFTY